MAGDLHLEGIDQASGQVPSQETMSDQAMKMELNRAGPGQSPVAANPL
jgi:hypothetical protein